MAVLEMPVVNNLDSYTFSVTLESVLYTFELKYNKRRDRWLADIYDQQLTPLSMGVPMLTNVDVMHQFVSNELPTGVFLVFDLSGQNNNPGQFDLGDNVLLLYEESTTE